MSGVADLRLGTSWLHEVVRYKLGGSLAAQLVAAGTSLDAGDMKGNTALHYSLEVGDIEVCREVQPATAHRACRFCMTCDMSVTISSACQSVPACF